MSKQNEADNERIPSYEESLANSPPYSLSTASPQKISPRQTIQERTRQERTRRITALIINHLEQAITHNLENGINHFLLILIPSDAFPRPVNVSPSSITSPTLTLPPTLVRLNQNHWEERQEDYRSSFLTQSLFIQDLTLTLHNSLINPETPCTSSSGHIESNHQRQPTPPLPERPQPKSWLARNIQRLSISPADHDPTGSTGNWNLGWRSEQPSLLDGS